MLSFVCLSEKFRHPPLYVNILRDPSRLISPTPHSVIGSQSGHNLLNQTTTKFHDLACPAGFEPAGLTVLPLLKVTLKRQNPPPFLVRVCFSDTPPTFGTPPRSSDYELYSVAIKPSSSMSYSAIALVRLISSLESLKVTRALNHKRYLN